jgi:hypothetical protein
VLDVSTLKLPVTVVVVIHPQYRPTFFGHSNRRKCLSVAVLREWPLAGWKLVIVIRVQIHHTYRLKKVLFVVPPFLPRNSSFGKGAFSDPETPPSPISNLKSLLAPFAVISNFNLHKWRGYRGGGPISVH